MQGALSKTSGLSNWWLWSGCARVPYATAVGHTPSFPNQARCPPWRLKWQSNGGTLHSTIWICPASQTKPGTATLTAYSIIQYVTTAYSGLYWSFKIECESPKKVVPTALQLLSTAPPPPEKELVPQPPGLGHVAHLTCKSKSSFKELLRCCILQV